MIETTTYQPFSDYDMFGQQFCSVCNIELNAQNTHPVSGDVIAYCIDCAERVMLAERMAFFCAAAAQYAERRATEKKSAAEAKKQSALSIIGRATFKATGATLFGIEDRRSKEPVIMHLTFIAGRVRGCVNAATGEECSGRRWSGHCCHEDRVMAYEAARTDVQACAEEHDMIDAPAAGSLAEWVERVTEEATWDDRRRAFEAIKKEIQHIEMRHEMGLVSSIEQDEFVDPFAGMSEQEQREAYRIMYSDDFYFAA